MAFNIESFKSQGLQFGGARPSLFRVILSFPAGVSTGALALNGGRASFLVKSAALPASTIGEIDVSYFGRKIKLAGDRTFDDWTITILNDEDFHLRNAMEEWSNLMNTLISNRLDAVGLATPDTYKVDLEVQQFGKAGPGDDSGVIRAYRFVGAFPTQVSAITLDWDRNNTIEEFDVRFVYDYWEPILTSTPIYEPILSSP
jgi:hypothetical protein